MSAAFLVRTGRVGAAAATVGLVVAGLAAPAAASADPNGYAHLYSHTIAVGVGQDSPGKVAKVGVYTDAKENKPEFVTLMIDAKSAAEVLTVTGLDESCATADHVTTCKVALDDPLWGGGDAKINLKLRPGVRVGTTTSLRLAAEADGIKPYWTTHSIRVVDSEPDFGAEDFTLAEVKPKEVVPVRPKFRVNGDTPVSRVGIYVWPGPLDFTERYRNCWYGERWAHMYCEFEIGLAPGESAQVAAGTPVRFQASPAIPHRWKSYLKYHVVNAPGAGGPEGWTAGDGPALRLEKVPSDGVRARAVPVFPENEYDDGDGIVNFRTGDNPADLVALGATVSGAQGAEVPIRVGLRNDGPANVFSDPEQEGVDWKETPEPAVIVTLPEGTTVVGMPEGHRGFNVQCGAWADGKFVGPLNEPNGRVYHCTSNSGLDVGDEWFFEFRVRVTGNTSAAGSVVGHGGGHDPDMADNTAPITLNVTPSGPTGGGEPGEQPGGGSGAGGSGGAGGAGGSGGGTGSGATSGTGSLPVTGSPVTAIAGGGLFAVAAGAALYLAARRRRPSSTLV